MELIRIGGKPFVGSFADGYRPPKIPAEEPEALARRIARLEREGHEAAARLLRQKYRLN